MSDERDGAETGSPARELSTLLRYLQNAPDDAAANRRAGWLLAELDRCAEAVGYLKRSVEVEPDHAAGWYYLGIAAHHAGDQETARNAFERLEQLAPEDALGLARRANAMRKAGRPDRAVELARHAVELETDPLRRSWIHAVLAQSYDALGDSEGRIRHLEEAFKADPESPYPIDELGFSHFEQRHYRAALPFLEKRAHQRPEDGDTWYALGISAGRVADWHRSREALEKAIALGHESASACGELGNALRELGDYRTALEYLERALELAEEPRVLAWVHESLGYAYKELHDRDAMLEHYQAAVRLDPNNSHCRQCLGAVYAELRDFEAALPHLEEAIRLAPDDAHAWYVLGEALAWSGELDRAQEVLERAVALGHGDGKARARLAWIYQRLGRPRAAAEQAGRALRAPLPKKWRAWVAAIVNDSQKQRR